MLVAVWSRFKASREYFLCQSSKAIQKISRLSGGIKFRNCMHTERVFTFCQKLRPEKIESLKKERLKFSTEVEGGHKWRLLFYRGKEEIWSVVMFKNHACCYEILLRQKNIYQKLKIANWLVYSWFVLHKVNCTLELEIFSCSRYWNLAL